MSLQATTNVPAAPCDFDYYIMPRCYAFIRELVLALGMGGRKALQSRNRSELTTTELHKSKACSLRDLTLTGYIQKG